MVCSWTLFFCFIGFVFKWIEKRCHYLLWQLLRRMIKQKGWLWIVAVYVCCLCCWSDSRSMTELQSVLEERGSSENELIRIGQIIVWEPDVEEHRANVNSNGVLEWRTKAFRVSEGKENPAVIVACVKHPLRVFEAAIMSVSHQKFNLRLWAPSFKGEVCLLSVHACYGPRKRGCRLIVL